MSEMLIDELVVRLGLDTSSLQADARQATATFSRLRGEALSLMAVLSGGRGLARLLSETGATAGQTSKATRQSATGSRTRAASQSPGTTGFRTARQNTLFREPVSRQNAPFPRASLPRSTAYPAARRVTRPLASRQTPVTPASVGPNADGQGAGHPAAAAFGAPGFSGALTSLSGVAVSRTAQSLPAAGWSGSATVSGSRMPDRNASGMSGAAGPRFPVRFPAQNFFQTVAAHAGSEAYLARTGLSHRALLVSSVAGSATVPASLSAFTARHHVLARTPALSPAEAFPETRSRGQTTRRATSRISVASPTDDTSPHRAAQTLSATLTQIITGATRRLAGHRQTSAAFAGLIHPGKPSPGRAVSRPTRPGPSHTGHMFTRYSVSDRDTVRLPLLSERSMPGGPQGLRRVVTPYRAEQTAPARNRFSKAHTFLPTQADRLLPLSRTSGLGATLRTTGHAVSRKSMMLSHTGTSVFWGCSSSHVPASFAVRTRGERAEPVFESLLQRHTETRHLSRALAALHAHASRTQAVQSWLPGSPLLRAADGPSGMQMSSRACSASTIHIGPVTITMPSGNPQAVAHALQGLGGGDSHTLTSLATIGAV